MHMNGNWLRGSEIIGKHSHKATPTPERCQDNANALQDCGA